MRLSLSLTGRRVSTAAFFHGLYAWSVLAIVELTLARLRAFASWDAGLDPGPLEVLALTALFGLLGGAAAVGIAPLLERGHPGRVLESAPWLRARLAAMLALWGVVVLHACASLVTAGGGAARAPFAVLLSGTLVVGFATYRACAPSPGRWRPLRALLSPWAFALLVLVPVAVLGLVGEAMAPRDALSAAGAALLLGVAATAVVRRLGPRFARMPVVTTVLLALLLVDPRTPDHRLVQAAGSAATGPNVVLVTLDGVRADHLSLLGYERETTPAIEARAGELLVFERAVAPATTTLGSHASLFTGLLPSRHGAHVTPSAPAGLPLPGDRTTLAEELHGAGYATAGISANWGYLGPGLGLWQGFETFDARQRRRLWQGGHPALVTSWPLRWLRGATDIAAGWLRYRSAGELLRQSRTTLRELRADPRPFFLFLDAMDAHAPYWSPAPYRDAFGPPVRDEADYLAQLPPTPGARRALAPEVRREQLDRYDGAILYLDRFVDELLALLADEGVLDDTLVVVTGDHGEAFGEHGLVGHGVSTYEEQVHVPLLLRFPGTRETGRVQRRVSTLDVFPTVLAACGLPVPADLDAEDLLGAERRGPVVTESYESPRAPTGRGVERAVYEGRWKAIASALGTELYDLAMDPEELVDHTGDEQLGALEARAFEGRARPVEALGRSGPPPAAAVRRLRAIGYTD